MNEPLCEITPDVKAGAGQRLVVLAGPCVIESRDQCLMIATHMKAVCDRLGLSYVFKASFDKANRTSADSARGPGLEDGLEVLAAVRKEVGVPVTTDIHTEDQAVAAAECVELLQIPAFLCRQTDLLAAAGATGRAVNIKKGQFMAPQAMAHAVEKVTAGGNNNVMLTERGTTFGYGNLVVDMRSLAIMRGLGVPVVFDATHSVQLPSGQGDVSGGQREFVPVLARAAAAAGIDALFIETHPDPDNALSDGPNTLPLLEVEAILKTIKQIHELGTGA